MSRRTCPFSLPMSPGLSHLRSMRRLTHFCHSSSEAHPRRHCSPHCLHRHLVQERRCTSIALCPLFSCFCRACTSARLHTLAAAGLLSLARLLVSCLRGVGVSPHASPGASNPRRYTTTSNPSSKPCSGTAVQRCSDAETVT